MHSMQENVSHIYEGTVTGNESVRMHRRVHQVPTEDGEVLLMTRKTPVDRNRLGTVLLVHGLAQNRFSWTLPGRSMENYLVSQGLETFNVELRGHGLSRAIGGDYPESFETYLKFDIPAIIQRVSELTHGEKFFYIGHSLGGTIAYCMDPSLQVLLAGIISIAGPFQAFRGNSFVTILAKLMVLYDRAIDIRKRHPRPFFADLAGMAVKRTLFLTDSPLNLLPLQGWFPGSMERELLIDRIDKGFDRTSFNVFWLLIQWAASGRLHATDAQLVYENNIREMKIPILFILGDKDSCVPRISLLDAYEMAGARDKTLKTYGDEAPGLHWGHLDLIFGKAAPDFVWPDIRKWMFARLPKIKTTG